MHAPISRSQTTIYPSLHWDGNHLVFLTRILSEKGEAKNLVSYQLENDGAVLVAEESFRGPGREYDNRWVFNTKAVWVMLTITCLASLSCTKHQETSAEESAIAALLKEESQQAIDGNIDGLLSLYVQDSKNARLTITKSVSSMITGWESIRKHQINLLKSDWMDWKEKKFRKENLWIKVNGNNAWAVCDNIWQWRVGDQRKQFQNIQITICEKHNGHWKIAFQAFIRDPEHLDVIDIP